MKVTFAARLPGIAYPMFQSPCGEAMVKAIGITLHDRRKSGRFQSPCGEVAVKAEWIENPENYPRALFQSPCGEVMVKGAGTNDKCNGTTRFQSPCGEVLMKALLVILR